MQYSVGDNEYDSWEWGPTA